MSFTTRTGRLSLDLTSKEEGRRGENEEAGKGQRQRRKFLPSLSKNHAALTARQTIAATMKEMS